MGYQVTITDAAKDFIASKGYDVQYGARPLKRAIQNYVEDGLGERIIEKGIQEGESITIDKHPEKEELVIS